MERQPGRLSCVSPPHACGGSCRRWPRARCGTQARYLVERQDLDTYAKVLGDDNEHRRAIIDQLVGTALPESKHPEMVSACVKAFMAAGLQSELIKLLEMLVLQVRRAAARKYRDGGGNERA